MIDWSLVGYIALYSFLTILSIFAVVMFGAMIYMMVGMAKEEIEDRKRRKRGSK